MPFLIDGHNVISALTDIDLEDPHDEAKLVLKLRAWAGHFRRKAFIIFDGGIPGGYSPELSRNNLHVIFAARRHSNADNIIRERLQHLRDTPNWTVVSSDLEVLDNAREAGARVMTAQKFAEQLERGWVEEKEKPEAPAAGEIEEWLEIFGEVEDILDEPKPQRQAQAASTEKGAEAETAASASPTLPEESRMTRTERPIGEQLGLPPETYTPPPRSQRKPEQDTQKPTYISEEEVEVWLEVFHDEPEPPPAPKKRPSRKRPRRKRPLAVDKETPTPEAQKAEAKRKRRKKLKRKWLHTKARQAPVESDEDSDSAELSDEDIALWHRLYGEEPGE